MEQTLLHLLTTPSVAIRYLYWNCQLGNDDKQEHVVVINRTDVTTANWVMMTNKNMLHSIEQLFIYIIDVTTSSVAVLMEMNARVYTSSGKR
eukprot:scaffold4822_cov67-Attheya_sp.AAC.1